MKRMTFILGILLCLNSIGFSQCSVNSFIEDNYNIDTKLLALREILSDPSDPDFDNPFVPQARVIPYIEKLSAIFENPNNEPIIDSLFNELQIHVNSVYHQKTEYKSLVFSVDTNVSWVQALKDTGISGFATLDDFFADYQLSVTDYVDLVNLGVTHFTMTTSYDFLNIFAILDDLEAIPDINNASIGYTGGLGLNYTGIPYTIYDPDWGTYPAAVCDILVDNNTYTFFIGGGDCFNGCVVSKSWSIDVSEDCSTVVLGSSEMEMEKFAIYPNPSSEIIHIHGVTSEINSTLIYSVGGQLIHTATSNSETIDISNLSAGLYFLEVTTSEGNKQTQKFIKN